MRITAKQHRVLQALHTNPAGLKAHEFRSHGVWFWFTSIHDLLEGLMVYALVSEVASFTPTASGLTFRPIYVLSPAGRRYLARRPK